jgi:membrane complex biogenesis BtpA family protein
MAFTDEVLGRSKALLGVVHMLPLPGSPLWGGSMEPVLTRALADARTLADAGFDGIILENFGDVPFARDFAGRGAVAAMAAVGARVADAVGVPLGVNVLRNDALSAVAVAAAIGARFVRVNVHVGAAVCDQGLVQGEAMATMMAVRDMSPGLHVMADVGVKHASPLGARSIEEEASDAVERGMASALIVTGVATGSPASTDDVARVRGAVPGAPVFVGSGVTVESLASVLSVADGVIVGSHVMENGKAGGPVDPNRARALVAASGR